MAETKYSRTASKCCKIVLVRNGNEYTIDYFAKKSGMSRSCAMTKFRQLGYIPEGWGKNKGDGNYYRLTIPWTDKIEQECKVDKRFNRPGARKGQSDQLCWTCRKCYGGCPWADAFVLPEGAVAEPSHRAGNHRLDNMDTYRITKCPMYEQDTRDPFEVRSDEPDAVKRLLRGIVKRAVKDYARSLCYVRDNPELLSPENIEALEKSQFQFGAVRIVKDCEAFFRSEWFEDILDELGIESFPPSAWIKAIQADPDRIASARGVFGSEEDDIDDEEDTEGDEDD